MAGMSRLKSCMQLALPKPSDVARVLCAHMEARLLPFTASGVQGPRRLLLPQVWQYIIICVGPPPRGWGVGGWGGEAPLVGPRTTAGGRNEAQPGSTKLVFTPRERVGGEAGGRGCEDVLHASGLQGLSCTQHGQAVGGPYRCTYRIHTGGAVRAPVADSTRSPASSSHSCSTAQAWWGMARWWSGG